MGTTSSSTPAMAGSSTRSGPISKTGSASGDAGPVSASTGIGATAETPTGTTGRTTGPVRWTLTTESGGGTLSASSETFAISSVIDTSFEVSVRNGSCDRPGRQLR